MESSLKPLTSPYTALKCDILGGFFCVVQAPANMKSVLQAGWLLTVAFGNVIVLIVAEGAGLEQV